MAKDTSIAQIRAHERSTDFAPASLTSSAQAADVSHQVHKPVLLQNCVDLAKPALSHAEAIGVDGTLGLAGHSSELLAQIPYFHLIGIDRDGEALSFAQKRLEPYADRVTFVHDAFTNFDEILDRNGIDRVDMVLLDLGLSSLQIDEKDRGFAYSAQAPLDMRMDERQSLTAADLIATCDADTLSDIFTRYGQERFARRIARAIVEEREETPITTTMQLATLVDRVVPRKGRPAGNPAKRVFQALRIAVNGELDQLAHVLPQIAAHLNVGGRLIVESYHSLEDRIVKSFITLGTRAADIPHGLPVIPEQMKPYFADLTHGAIKADEEEIARNSRSASVRLRAVELTRPLPEHAHADMRYWLEKTTVHFGSSPAERNGRHNSRHSRNDSKSHGGNHSQNHNRNRQKHEGRRLA